MKTQNTIELTIRVTRDGDVLTQELLHGTVKTTRDLKSHDGHYDASDAIDIRVRPTHHIDDHTISLEFVAGGEIGELPEVPRHPDGRVNQRALREQATMETERR